jgi:membrane protease YdiL (CAAX protease family)
LKFGFGIDLAAAGLSVRGAGSWLPLTLALSAVGFAIGFLSKKSPADLVSYPQFLPSRWTVTGWTIEIGSWSIYLAAYEFAFRGYLLAALAPLGPVAAVTATTALYAVAHLPKSSKEAAGAVPFGVIASLLSLRYGSIVPAFAIHLAIALGNDSGSLRAIRKMAAE